MKGHFFGYLHSNPLSSASEASQAMAGAAALKPMPAKPGNAWISSDDISYTADEGQCQAVVLGNPRWANSELESIAREKGHAAALIKGWQKFGNNVVENIQNHFALALTDSTKNEALLAIDRLGIGSLYYTCVNKNLVFGTRIDTIHSHPSVRASLDPQGIFNYLFFHMIPSPGTAFTDLRKLGPAQCLHWKGAAWHISNYWSPNFIEQSNRSMDTAADEMLSTLGDCVKDASAQKKAGSFLSGGIDSSTVSGLLAQQSENAVDTYSIGFNAEGYDEIPFARIASKHFGTNSHEYYVKPEDIAETVHTIAAAYEEPFGNSSALPAYYCAKVAAADGIQRLLAGDGGDELFAGNQRYSKQFIFERYFILPKILRQGFIEPIAKQFSSSSINLLRKSSSYVEQARVPLPDRFETYNFLNRFGDLSGMLAPDFLSQIDTEHPLNLMRQRYQEPENASTLNRMLYLDWKFTLADNDIRKVTGMCHLAGIEVAYPMMDDRMLELSCTVPSTWKLSNGQLRYFFKHAIRDFVPNAIITKKKHGFGLPFGVWTSSNPELQALAYENVRNLKERGIFRSDFLESAIKLHQEGHSTYYGTLVWVLMMLELWLKTHKL